MRLLYFLYQSRMNKNGQVPVYIRITISGKREQFATGLFINPSSWNSSKQRVRGRNDLSASLNETLSRIETDIRTVYNELCEVFKGVSAKDVRSNYLQEDLPSQGLNEVFKEHNEKIAELVGGEYSKETFKVYERTRRNVKEFIKHKWGHKDVRLDRLNRSFAQDYIHFLRSEKEHGSSTIHKHLQRLNKVVNYAVTYELIPKNPFRGVQVRKEKKQIQYLTMEEINRIRNKEFGIQRIEVVRDLYVFQLFTGLAYRELKNLSYNHISKDEVGQVWISMVRQKSGRAVKFPLLPQAVEILNKYKEHTLDLSRKALPVPSNQKMNSYLKEIGDLCRIQQPLTTHLARKSFSTTIALANGVPIESLSKLLGHAKIATTLEIYSEVVDSKLSKDLNDLQKKLG